jgi:hypothetical protein
MVAGSRKDNKIIIPYKIGIGPIAQLVRAPDS